MQNELKYIPPDPESKSQYYRKHWRAVVHCRHFSETGFGTTKAEAFNSLCETLEQVIEAGEESKRALGFVDEQGEPGE